MHFYLYQITNNVNGKIYAGVHKTTDLDDGYMGSGKILKAAIKKYGIENFTKEILIFFDNSADMFAAEKELVTDEFLLREDTYNLRRGGTGGFDYINANPETCLTEKRLTALAANNLLRTPAYVRKFNTSSTFREMVLQHLTRMTERSRLLYPEGTFKGKTHKNETKQKMSLAHKERLQDPTKNSQFGSMWITNGTENRKIKKQDPLPDGWVKGRKIGSTLQPDTNFI